MPAPDSSRTISLPADGLPLTPFEEHMLVDDRPTHPMVIVTRFDFVGDAPPANLEEAFLNTVQNEPLLTARIETAGGRRPRWVPGDMPRLHRSRGPRLGAGPSQWTPALPRLDPRSGPVLHAELVEHGDGWSIALAVHHAACDGLGTTGFMERWLLAVDGKPGRRRRPPEDVMAALLARGRIASSWSRFARMLPRLAKGLEGVKEFMAHDVTALADEDDASRVPRAEGPWQPAVVSATLDDTLVDAVEHRAKETGVRVNDLLAMALAATLGDHVAAAPHRQQSPQTPWIRIGIPMSLRTKDDHLLPAANRVSMIFLDRQPDDRHDRERLAAGIRDQMEIIEKHALGHIFPLSLAAGRLLPGGLRRSAHRPRPQCTAVLSNLGRFFDRTPLVAPDGAIRVGGSRMAGWWAVPPIRPGTALAACTHETCGHRTIAFHVDPDRLRPETAEGLLGRMVSELETLAATGMAPAMAAARGDTA
jgi:hypothetical protein